MDWKKAKNYIIVFLLALNLLLLGFNVLNHKRYRLTPSKRKAITQILENNNFEIACEIPKRFPPLSQLSIKQSSYDFLKLQKVFFGDSSDIIRTKEFDTTIFKSNNMTLNILEGNVSFVNDNRIQNFELNRENAIGLCKPYLSRIGKDFAELKLSFVSENDDFIILEYNQYFGSEPIFNNHATFKVYSNGTISCNFSYYPLAEPVGEKNIICSSDEALFSFFKEFTLLAENKKIVITDIDLGYYIFLDSSVDETGVSTAPHYRIYIDGEELPFYVNAYTKTLVYN